MNETQKRIKAYKDALPGLRERVIAVALLLVISASMMTSATFAWITLSRAPEVTDVSTTVAANGNLEIALADEEFNEPDESKIGDSSAAEDQSLIGANLTWGNLVNLSDPSYGLDEISLRPALLSDYNLNRYPLYGASYGMDGRVTTTADRYEFATWTTASDGTPYFAAGDDSTYGVRAIASVKYENITGNAVLTEMISNAQNAYAGARTEYAYMIDGITKLDEQGKVSCIDALSDMMQVYVQSKADSMLGTSFGTDNYGPYIRYFYKMIEIFKQILDEEGEALLHLANLQVYLNNSDATTETFANLDALLNASDADLENLGVDLESLSNYKDNRTKVIQSMETLEPLSTACDPNDPNCPVVTWSEISGIVNQIVDIGSAELNEMQIGTLGRGDIEGLLSAALGGGDNKVVIKDGVLPDTEQRLGERLEDHGITVSISVKATLVITMTVPVSAAVVTDAVAPFTSNTDMQATEEMGDNSAQGGDAVAKDTYGMAIDLWVRTNIADSVLTLEGSTIYKTIPDTGVNKNGVETELYVLTVEGSSMDVYSLDGVWYFADSHEAVDESLLEGATPTAKTVDVVEGYQGENRIWENWEDMLELGYIHEDSTTQGSGSCYVFYANPSDQTRILDLLSAFTIAFVDENGSRLAVAMLDIENAYAINGKVTVPLKVTSGTSYIDEENGQTMTGITALDQNRSTRITAIIYLNGMYLENQDVLATGKIQGQLNIQFGSSVSLTSFEDTELQKVYRTITAQAVSEGQSSTNEDSPITFDYDGTAKNTTVTLEVVGEQPQRITGFFVRAINSSQGSQGKTMSFEGPDDDGKWTADFSMTTPGKYILRSLIVDGVEYTLESCPTVIINGLTVSSVSSSLSSGIVMTADRYIDVDVSAVINATEDLMPNRVRAQFRSADGREYNATLTYDSLNKVWTGTASITSSGTYSLEYLIMDGEYTELSDNQKTTLIVYLGMTTQVWSSFSTEPFKFTEPVTIPVQTKIWDDTGAEIRGLEDVDLYYHVSGSALDQNGMHAEMEWNASTGFYEGDFSMLSAGEYSFNRLQVTNEGSGSSTIRNAISAPVFTAQSPEPPEYYADVAGYEYQFVTNNSAALHMDLAYTRGAKVWAKVRNINSGVESMVPGSIGGMKDVGEVQINEWSFPIPVSASGNQNGEWQITELYFQGVYVNDKNYPAQDGVPTAENSYVMDVSDKGTHETHGIYTYVVSTVNVAVHKEGTSGIYTGENFGVDANGSKTGAFMQSYDVSGVTISVTDWNGAAIRDISGVTWTIRYDSGTTERYGGYTGATLSENPITLTDDGTHTRFTAPTQTFRFAGEYSTSITFQIGGITYTANSAPAFTVSSVTPTVSLTTLSPSGQLNVHNASGTYVANGANARIDGNTAYVYFQCNRSGSGSNCDPYEYNYVNPELTMTLAGIGFAENATLTMTDTTHVYSRENQTNILGWTMYTTVDSLAYSWSEDGTCKRYIGYFQSGAGTDTKTAVGDTPITASALVLTDSDGAEYTVDIPDITITNPY